jgi:AraC-like DNA-binding protein
MNPVFIRWVNLIVYGFFVAFLLVNVCRIGLYFLADYKDLFVFVSFFVFFVYFTFLFYNAIGHPELFQKIEEKNEVKSHIIPENEAQQLLKELNDYMQQKEPYLNPELSLKQLAIEMGTNERFLSGVINQYKKQNFYDFINNYRVSKAKRLLMEQKHRKRTVQEIFYDSGFNSKSTFNFAFKKYIGITPTEFKKQYAHLRQEAV